MIFLLPFGFVFSPFLSIVLVGSPLPFGEGFVDTSFENLTDGCALSFLFFENVGGGDGTSFSTLGCLFIY